MNVKLLIFSSMLILTASSAIQTDQEMDSMTTKAINSDKKIKLFVYNGCPWCKKVIEFLKQIGHLDKITIMDLSSAAHMQELKNLNHNNTQAPYLFDEPNNIGMLESGDIIKYFSTRF